ncbi:tRNA (adenosine(37)-N6)-dimethylallyltransferase MiaA [Rhodomicrobium vannielii ATCC 17100]|uniref:tRNA (adenosine(37)-N6)-dimethylallyltransferase MiaA n=1 Tax=Rhodomicrobium vannielii TaxID=1069 RepID=UPI001918AA74|nr:tRNA (adenosine(37)-N6)-dimethylallyltransferase MiaA [Rhodomicrobium vannielii]MBJ7535495.1 tRNA (adenosine(37)-N6)-dimethylallyltransferase MiaA [Rhodomicrobium vannielii ATCC 17100]
MTDEKPRAILIIGATASGKSALALDVAERFGGVVINADSMQVYAELRIITNRPTPAEEARAPHRLYGFRPAREPYSTALWLADVAREVADAEARGLLPVIVGGTGLYFKALTEGLSIIPEIPAEIRAHYRLRAEIEPTEALHAELSRRDAATAASIRPSDPQRIARALEVLEATGRPLADWHAQKEPPLLSAADVLPVVVEIDRAALYRRCDERFDRMIEAGAIEEARAIDALHLDAALPAMRAVGLPPLIAFARGEISLGDAAERAKTATRNYAKRQLTWIRNNFISRSAVFTKEMQGTKSEINLFIRKRLTDSP